VDREIRSPAPTFEIKGVQGRVGGSILQGFRTMGKPFKLKGSEFELIPCPSMMTRKKKL